MTVYASIPDRLFRNNLTDFWAQYSKKLHQDYPEAKITSNYTGDGELETCDVAIFLYEFKDDESTLRDITRCKELCKMYNFYINFYAPSRFGF